MNSSRRDPPEITKAPPCCKIQPTGRCTSFAFQSDTDFQMWYDEHHEEYDEFVNQTCAAEGNVEEIGSALEEMGQTWVVVVEMRKYICDLLRNYHSHANAQFYHDFIQQ